MFKLGPFRTKTLNGPGIEDNAVEGAARDLYPLHDLRFGVALSEFDLQRQYLGPRGAGFFDVRQRFAAIKIRFADAKHVQIGAVQDQNPECHL